MSGYEELSPEQIIFLGKLVLVIVSVIMLGKVIPAILQFRTMKFLEVKITSKCCDEEATPFQRLLNWFKERKDKKESYYLERYKK